MILAIFQGHETVFIKFLVTVRDSAKLDYSVIIDH